MKFSASASQISVSLCDALKLLFLGYPTNICCFTTFLCRNRCENKTLCMEKLSLVLPDIPPLFPRQYDRCAVIGNSGDLLKTKFGKEIDSYDAVFRENGAPIQVR